MTILRVAALAVLSVLTAVSGTTYYVSSSLGDDAWSGTLPEPDPGGTDGPKRTIGAADALLDHTVGPGDSLLLRRGDTWTGTDRFGLASTAGAPDAPVVVGAYGTGARPRLELSGTGAIISIRGSDHEPTSYVVFESLLLTTSASPGNRPIGVSIVETVNPSLPHHITFDSLLVDGLRSGLAIQFTSHITIRNCTIRDNYGIDPETGHTQGLYCHADTVTVRNNHFENNGKPDSWFDWNTYLSHGSGYLYEGNTVCNALSGVKLRRANGAIVRGNTFFGLNLVGISVGGDANGGIENVVIERNLIHHTVDGITIKDQSGGGDVGITNLIVRNNILHSNRTDAPSGGYAGYLTITDDPIRNVSVCNNLIYGVAEKRSVVVANTDPEGLRLVNNVIARTDTARPALVFASSVALARVELDNNLYHVPGGPIIEVEGTAYTDLASFRDDYPAKEAEGLEGNPGFADAPSDFGPADGEALTVDNGADAAGVVDSDFLGVARPQDGDLSGTAEWDIGPYEFPDPSGVAGATAPRPTHSPETRGVGILTNLHVAPTAGMAVAWDLAGRVVRGGFRASRPAIRILVSDEHGCTDWRP